MKNNNLTKNATFKIRNAIIFGELKLGEALSEFGVCEKYNLSKTPVREAFTILNHEGLINKINRKGCFVFDITVNEIEQIAELRYLYENFAIKKSIRNNKIEFIDRLEDIYLKMKDASDSQNYLKYLNVDTEFHKSFFIYANNKYLENSYNNLSNKIQALRYYVVKNAVEGGEGIKSHKTILDAAKNENYDMLSENLKKHLITWLNKYRLSFKIDF